MKIALVCPYNMFDHPGGVQQVVMHLAEGLRSRKHIVKIITPRPVGFRGELPKDYILLGTSTKFNPAMGTVGTLTFDVGGKEVRELLEKEKFDVINFHEPWAPVLARFILPHSTLAHVGTFHANLTDSPVAKSIVNMFTPYGRGIGEKMHVITAVSPAPASLLIDKAKKNSEYLVNNIRYIPNGIDLKTYTPPKHRVPLTPGGVKTIVYVGRLEKRKGVDNLVRAYSILAEQMPNTKLVIAGKGSKLSELQRIIKSKKIPNVEFKGYVSEEEKRRLLGNADLVSIPAMYGESFGIILVEAMAMGAPVIAGANVGYKSVMTGHGRIGLVNAEALEDFANRMAVFLTEPAIEKIMRSWGLKESQKYDYQSVITQYEEAYKEAIRLSNIQKKNEAENGTDKRGIKKIISRAFIRRQPR